MAHTFTHYAFMAFRKTADGQLGTPSAAPTVSCVNGLDGSAIAGASITAIATGVYRVEVDTDQRYPIFIAETTDSDYGDAVALGEDLANEVWDEPLTGATHNVATSSGKRLRDIAGNVVHTGTAQGAGANGNQIQLDTGAASLDGAYDPSAIAIVAGTGAGQIRLCLEYVGSTRMATVDRGWKVQPDTTSEFVIYADPGREHVNEGLAQAGGTATITLNALASSNDDVYVGQVVFIRSGTGEDQAKRVTAYNGTTKVATVESDWAVVPDTTSAYVMLPTSSLQLADLITDAAAAVWTYATRVLTNATVTPTVGAFTTATDITDVRGNDWSIDFDLTQDLTSKKIQIAIKALLSDTDAEAIIFVDTDTGLITVNGSTSGVTAGNGSITVTDASEGQFTFALKAAVTALLESPKVYQYAVQIVDTTTVLEAASGKFTLLADAVRDVTLVTP